MYSDSMNLQTLGRHPELDSQKVVNRFVVPMTALESKRTIQESEFERILIIAFSYFSSFVLGLVAHRLKVT